MSPVFSPFAAIGDPLFTRRLAYLTDTHASDDGTEQRRAVRVIPREEWSFLARTIQPATTGWLDTLAYGGTDDLYTIPYWPHGALLESAASSGFGVTLAVDTAGRDFVSGGRAVLWRGEAHDPAVAPTLKAEEVTLTGVTSSTITVTSLVNTWAAGTYVFPAKRGRFTGNIDLRRLASFAAEAPLSFAIEHGSDPGVTLVTEPDVFDVVPYIRRDVSHQLDRLVDRIESETYTYADYARRETPIGARPFRVWLNSRTAVQNIIAWFHGQRGALAPFWLPTYQQDLHVISGLGTASLTIKRCGFAATRPSDGSRDHLAFIGPNGTVTHRTITGAADNGIGAGTESLTLDGAAPSNTSLASFLLLVRLASDVLEIRWRTRDFAECELAVVELPAEVAEV